MSEKFIKNLKNLKKEINTFVKKNQIKDLQKKAKKAFDKANKDLGSIAEKEMNKAVKLFNAEKKQVETLIQKTVPAEIQKMKDFLDDQLKELKNLEIELEVILDKGSNVAKDLKAKATKKVTKKKTAKKATKKATKKVAKKATKKATKKVAKKATKKATKKVAKKATKKATKKVTKKATKKVAKK